MKTMIRKQRLALPGMLGICCAVAVGGGFAASEPVQLTPAGRQIETKYAAALKDAQQDLAGAIPKFDERKTTTFQQAREAVKKATAAVNASQQPLDKIAKAKALVDHAKGKWLGGAEKGLAQAADMLKKAKTPAEREAAEKERAKWQADKEAGLKALAERQAALDAAQADEAKSVQARKSAQAALDDAEAKELQAAKVMIADVLPLLSSDKLDAKLVKCAVLADATPQGLAEFAQQGPEQENLVRKLLGDTALMKQMLEAGGAVGPGVSHTRYSQAGGDVGSPPKSGGARYGEAMRIYTAIRQASPRSADGILERLALGTALEHAMPLAQDNATAAKDAPKVVDPVKRYLHYEKAYLAGELDEAFPKMSAWECRLITNSGAPDQVLAWGREMLRNYRPDHVINPDYGWRYSAAVSTDVAYRNTQFLKDDPKLEFFQNVMKEGGVCGRRGFFGRFICQAFGLPATCLKQPAHCALGRWTPQGWVVNLGGGWQVSSLGRPGPDFVLEAQARKQAQQYLKVLRAQWIGDALGEKKGNPWEPGSGGLWNQIAYFEKKMIVAEMKPQQLDALGTELGEANQSAETRAMAVAKATVTEADKKIVTNPNGAIVIPAAACGGGNHLVKSFLGGQQMIYGGAFTCEIVVPRPGKYSLTARVATVGDEQHLQLISNNNAREPIDLTIPYTLGAWQKTKPVEVSLATGKNVLGFPKPARGFALKDITLVPVN